MPERFRRTLVGTEVGTEREKTEVPDWNTVLVSIAESIHTPVDQVRRFLKPGSYGVLRTEYETCSKYLQGELSVEQLLLFYIGLMNYKQPQLFKTQSHVLASAALRKQMGVDLKTLQDQASFAPVK